MHAGRGEALRGLREDKHVGADGPAGSRGRSETTQRYTGCGRVAAAGRSPARHSADPKRRMRGRSGRADQVIGGPGGTTRGGSSLAKLRRGDRGVRFPPSFALCALFGARAAVQCRSPPGRGGDAHSQERNGQGKGNEHHAPVPSPRRVKSEERTSRAQDSRLSSAAVAQVEKRLLRGWRKKSHRLPASQHRVPGSGDRSRVPAPGPSGRACRWPGSHRSGRGGGRPQA